MLDLSLGIRLVLWSPHAGWNNRSAIALCYLQIDSIDALIFPALIALYSSTELSGTRILATQPKYSYIWT